MTTIYGQHRAYYLDDETGELWGTPNKTVRFDPVTYKEIIPGSEVISAAQTSAVNPEFTAEVKEGHTCPTCGFTAKSFAGLQVHKFKKHLMKE